MRTLVALLAAVAGPTLIVMSPFVYQNFQLPDPSGRPAWAISQLGGLALVTLAVTAAHVLLLGFPAFLLLRWKRLVRWWSLTGSGFVLGALPAVVLTALDSDLMAAGAVGGVLGALGAVGGLCFWLAWRQGAAASREM